MAPQGRVDGPTAFGGPLAGAGPVVVLDAAADALAGLAVETISVLAPGRGRSRRHRRSWPGSTPPSCPCRWRAWKPACRVPRHFPPPCSSAPASGRRSPTCASGLIRENIRREDILETIRRPSRGIAPKVVDMLTSRPTTSITDIRRLAGRLSGRDVPKLGTYASDLDTVVRGCRTSSAAALEGHPGRRRARRHHGRPRFLAQRGGPFHPYGRPGRTGIGRCAASRGGHLRNVAARGAEPHAGRRSSGSALHHPSHQGARVGPRPHLRRLERPLPPSARQRRRRRATGLPRGPHPRPHPGGRPRAHRRTFPVPGRARRFPGSSGARHRHTPGPRPDPRPDKRHKGGPHDASKRTRVPAVFADVQLPRVEAAIGLVVEDRGNMGAVVEVDRGSGDPLHGRGPGSGCHSERTSGSMARAPHWSARARERPPAARPRGRSASGGRRWPATTRSRRT